MTKPDPKYDPRWMDFDVRVKRKQLDDLPQPPTCSQCGEFEPHPNHRGVLFGGVNEPHRFSSGSSADSESAKAKVKK